MPLIAADTRYQVSAAQADWGRARAGPPRQDHRTQKRTPGHRPGHDRFNDAVRRLLGRRSPFIKLGSERAGRHNQPRNVSSDERSFNFTLDPAAATNPSSSAITDVYVQVCSGAGSPRGEGKWFER